MPVFPVIKELPHDRIEFLKAREAKHVKWIKAQAINEFEIFLENDIKSGNRELRRYSQEKFDAWEAIMWSFAILKHIFA